MSIDYRAFQSAQEHRRDLLREAGADREDVQRHLLELRRSVTSSQPTGRVAHIGLRLRRQIIAWLALAALIAGCGTSLSAGAGSSSDNVSSGWHVAPVDGSPEAVLYPEDVSTSDPIATHAVEDYPPQERDVPELSNLVRMSTESETDDHPCGATGRNVR